VEDIVAKEERILAIMANNRQALAGEVERMAQRVAA